MEKVLSYKQKFRENKSVSMYLEKKKEKKMFSVIMFSNFIFAYHFNINRVYLYSLKQ